LLGIEEISMAKKKPTKKLNEVYFPTKKTPNKPEKIDKPKKIRKKRKGLVRRYWVEPSQKREGYWVQAFMRTKNRS
jgi:hypothetical protein